MGEVHHREMERHMGRAKELVHRCKELEERRRAGLDNVEEVHRMAGEVRHIVAVVEVPRRERVQLGRESRSMSRMLRWELRRIVGVGLGEVGRGHRTLWEGTCEL